MINLFFFFGPTPPPQMSIADIFDIKQGKNSFNKQKENDSLSKGKEAILLTLNGIDFETHYIDITKLPIIQSFSEKNDRKYVLQPTDFLINRVGGYSKTMSMLMNNNFDKETTIVISQNFIFARPKKIFSNIPLAYLHFLLKVCIDILLKGKNEKDTKQQSYLTVSEIENVQIPSSLLIDFTSQPDYKKFEKLDVSLKRKYANVISSINELNQEKIILEKFKEHFEKKIKTVNENNNDQ